jgi:uncharacterized OsmC-like protein
MALTLRPKRFGPVFVRFDDQGIVSFATEATGPGQPHPPGDKPVLTLMASVGHCLVESIRIIAARDQTQLAAFAISVTGEKSLDAPGRLQTILCRVHGALVPDPEAMERLVKEAKTICTVSNSLSSEITLDIVGPETTR